MVSVRNDALPPTRIVSLVGWALSLSRAAMSAVPRGSQPFGQDGAWAGGAGSGEA